MKKILLLGLLAFTLQNASAQLRYNFFTGPDADLMQTTFKGFGSVGWDFTYPFLDKKFGEGKTQFFLGVNAGLTVRKFRFQNNYQFQDNGDHFSFVPDTSINVYTDNFFSYSKSKLVTTFVRINPEIGLSLKEGKFAMSVGPVVDILVQSKHKRKYKVDGEKQKYREKGREKHYVTPIQYGLRAAIGTFDYGVYYNHFLTPFFQGVENGSPDVIAAEVGFYYRSSF